MLKLTKGEKPQSLVDNATAWTAELVEAKKENKDYSEIESRYRQPDVLSGLEAETISKCAYCESRIGAVAYPHIEHIMPKGRFLDLTFDWDNLTLACPRCNTRKSTRVPTPNNFVHPYNDDPEQSFGYLGPFMYAVRENGAAAIMRDWLDLNRAGLVEGRLRVVSQVEAVYRTSLYMPRDARREYVDASLNPLTSTDSEYSAVARWTATAFESMYQDQLAELTTEAAQ